MRSTMLNPEELSINEFNRQQVHVEIIEQPASKSLRFRYEVEGRSTGSILGANSTFENKTYPAIQVTGYRGKALVVVSCVTKDFPYKPHPHNLVGREGCKDGVYTQEINNNNKLICVFSNLGIQCVKKRGIAEALKLREEIRVDPFHTGFAHKNKPQTIDLSAVRLCFQVFIEEPQTGRTTLALTPVVSEPIYDRKTMKDLTIFKLSDCSSPVIGGKEIIMLCDKVAKNDIEIVFFREEDGHIVWEDYGEFSARNVHRQVAISFRTPQYKLLEVNEPVNTYIQLRRPSDKECGEPWPFQFLPVTAHSRDNSMPMDSDAAEILKRKRQRFLNSNSHLKATSNLDNTFETHDGLASSRDVSPNIALEASRSEVGVTLRPMRHRAHRNKVRRESTGAPTRLNLPVFSTAGSRSPSTSPIPPYQDHMYQFAISPHYNIPLQSPNQLTTVIGPGGEDPIQESLRAANINIMDLDGMNIIEPQQAQSVATDAINDFNRAVDFPAATDGGNLQFLDCHLFSSLSLHDDDDSNEATTETHEEERVGSYVQSNESAMIVSSIPPEMPVLTFSGMLSTDLDGTDSFDPTNTINNLYTCL